MNKIFRQTLGLLSVAAAMSFTSCDSMLHDETTECPEGMVIQLVPKYAARTSFEAELTDVHIFIYNDKNALVDELKVDGAKLAQNGWQVEVNNMADGNYHLVVWNGLADTENYTERDAAVTLNVDADNVTNTAFAPLWHGKATDIKVEPLTQTHVTVPMVKDTNNFVIYICSTNGDVLMPGDFDLNITSANGLLDADNNVLDGSTITYNDYDTAAESIQGYLDAEIVPLDDMGYIPVIRSNINTLRLTEEHPSYLTVTGHYNHQHIITLNLNDYILKAFRSIPSNETITNQVYFDTEDLYNITLFVTPRENKADTSQGIYIVSYIRVNDWILRLQDVHLK